MLALAWLPSASVAWTFAPQALAGVGMGMALPAFAGELLPERTTREAAQLLTIRHVGIALVLIALAPLIAHRLDVVTERAQEQGVALVLDAKLPPQDKLTLAPALLGGVEAERPRAGLEQALADNGRGYDGGGAHHLRPAGPARRRRARQRRRRRLPHRVRDRRRAGAAGRGCARGRGSRG